MVPQIIFGHEHAVLKKLRENSSRKENTKSITLESIDTVFTMKPLSIYDMLEAQKLNDVDVNNVQDKSFLDQMMLSIEFLVRSITHIDNVPIEEIFGKPENGVTLSDIQEMRLLIREQVKIYLKEYLSSADIGTLINFCMSLINQTYEDAALKDTQEKPKKIRTKSE